MFKNKITVFISTVLLEICIKVFLIKLRADVIPA